MVTLKQARINAGLTQKQVADELNKTIITVQRYENGKTDLNAKTFLILCKLYGVSADEIILPHTEV